MRVGVLHPGEMGAGVALALRVAGHDVMWVSDGRSPATVERATVAELRDVATVDALTTNAEIILSVCPPGAALDVATAVAKTGFPGTYVDANAIAPATARAIDAIITDAGARFVDGGIVGPPPRAPGMTRLFLSGPSWPTAVVADLFAETPVTAVVVSETVGDASAVKIAYASWTKGSAALLLAARDYAHAAGSDVEAALIAEWERSQPKLAARADASREHSAPKAWRWVAEMHEIAAAFEEQALPRGFHEAAADIYDDMEKPELG